nr:lysozyme inhibitor LprI family protein [Sulfitobacter sp. M39]
MLCASPLAAQDLQYTDRGTEICLADADGFAAEMACVGVSANQCMEDSPGGNSTYGMGGCLDRELQFWDQRLNDNYAAVMVQAKRMDADAIPGPEGRLGVADSLREMQRAWIVFRDKACTYEASLWQGGTGRGPAAINCLMRQTARQALSLDVWEG